MMCLYIDYDNDALWLGQGTRTARKQHRCIECGRTIEPGERYEYVSYVMDGRADTTKTCAHCLAAVELGHRLTGCPKWWNVTLLYDRDPEIGYLANCAWVEEHPDLAPADRWRILRALACGRRGWRCHDGSLMDEPVAEFVGGEG